MKAFLKAVTVLLVGFTVIVFILTVVSTLVLDEKDRSFFGIGLYSVESDSMSLSDKNADLDVHFKTGDLIFVNKTVKAKGLKAGDVICFISTSSDSYGKTVTHMIREVKRNEKGEVLGFVTFGTHTGIDDEALALPQNLLGVYMGKISDLGSVFSFLNNPSGFFFGVILPLCFLCGYNLLQTVLLSKKYREEKDAAFIAALEKIREERIKSRMASRSPSPKANVQPKQALQK